MIVPQTMVAFKDYLTGQTLYIHMRPLSACENDDQERGWRDAWSADADFAGKYAVAREVDELQTALPQWQQ